MDGDARGGASRLDIHALLMYTSAFCAGQSRRRRARSCRTISRKEEREPTWLYSDRRSSSSVHLVFRSYGVWLQHYKQHQLKDYTNSDISWTGSL